MNRLPKMQISKIVGNIPEALSIYINQIVYEQKRRGKDMTVLSLGEAFFDIPMFDFSKLDFVKGYHYSDSQGIPELREKICKFYLKEYGSQVKPEEILVCAGSKPILFIAMQCTLNSGDEVLIHEPGWLSYQEQARLVGAVPKFIPYDCPVQDFCEYFTKNTKMLVINNPNNPSGRLYTAAELKTLYKHARSHGIYLLVDEAYSDFIIDEEFYSAANLSSTKDGVIVVNSLSKNMGMSGWRVGYVITEPSLIGQILKINQHIITCAPTVLLLYLIRYFDNIVSITLPQVRSVVEKRKRIADFMRHIELEYMGGESTFYFFVNIENFPSSSLYFSLYLILKHGIAVVPGSAYGDSTERFVRISIGTEPEEKIHEALQLIKDLINVKSFDEGFVDRELKRLGIKEFSKK